MKRATYEQEAEKTRRSGHWIAFDILLAGLAVALALWGFVELMEVARGTVPHAFDTQLLLAFREAGHPGNPIGPAWLPGAVRDITALGGTVVLVALTAVTVVGLWISRRRDKALLMLVAMAGGQMLGALLKIAVHRPRPDIVPHLVTETSFSFPSGHAMMSAIAYLTLAMMAASALHSSAARICLLALAVLATFLIGVSRIYLGVHWPSDVLAGWCFGFAWAMLCWLAARRLQRRKTVNESA